jgi:ABC-2 type transport system permease protein
MGTEVLIETLHERRVSLVWWALGVVGLVGLTVAFYPSVKGSSGLSDYAKDLPESLRGLFVGGEIDITSGAGYLNSQVFDLMAPLILLIFAIGAGAAAVAGEEERGTLDLLLAHPLRRRDFVAQRFLALSILVIALTSVLLLTVVVASALVNLDIGIADLIAACGANALLGLLFGTLALATGAIWPGAEPSDRGCDCACRPGLARRRAWASGRLARPNLTPLPRLPGDRHRSPARRNPLGKLGTLVCTDRLAGRRRDSRTRPA